MRFNNTPAGTLRIGSLIHHGAKRALANMTAEMMKEYPGLDGQPGDRHSGHRI